MTTTSRDNDVFPFVADRPHVGPHQFAPIQRQTRKPHDTNSGFISMRLNRKI